MSGVTDERDYEIATLHNDIEIIAWHAERGWDRHSIAKALREAVTQSSARMRTWPEPRPTTSPTTTTEK